MRLRHTAALSFTLLAALCGNPARAQSYDLTTQQLTLPTLNLGTLNYQSVVVKLDQISVLAIDNATAMARTAPNFDPAGSVLSLPTLNVGNTVYRGLIVKLEKFSVVSVGGSGGTNGTTGSTGGGTDTCATDSVTLTYAGNKGVYSDGAKVCFVTAAGTSLTVAGKTLTGGVANTAISAPYSAYSFTDGSNGYVYEVIFNGGKLHEINVSAGGKFLGQFAA